MKRDLLRYFNIGVPVELIYMDKGSHIHKRCVKLIGVTEDYVLTYCYMRHAPRTFLIANILAVAPVKRKRGKSA